MTPGMEGRHHRAWGLTGTHGRNKVNARLRYGLLLAAAVTAPVALAAALMPLRGRISETNVALLMVVAVAPVAFGSRVAGIVAALSAALAFDFFWTPPFFHLNTYYVQDVVGTAVYLAVVIVVSELFSQNLRHRTKAEELASEQAALRRVATLVAKGAPEGKVFAAVAEEVGSLADARAAQIFRYEPDGSVVRLAAWGSGTKDLKLGARYPPSAYNVAAMVLHSGRRARIDDTGGGPGQPAPIAGPPDSGSVVGDPIVMDGRVWGLVIVTMNRPGTSAGDAEQRIAGFTELVATAVSNVQRRTDLIASRRRIVAAGDQMRRRIERNLHDGAQQQLVSLVLQLRGARDGIPDGLAQARAELAQVEEGLANVLERGPRDLAWSSSRHLVPGWPWSGREVVGPPGFAAGESRPADSRATPRAGGSGRLLHDFGGGGERRQARQRLGCRSRSQDRQRSALRPCP